MLPSGQILAPAPLQVTSLPAQQMPQLSLRLHIANTLSLNFKTLTLVAATVSYQPNNQFWGSAAIWPQKWRQKTEGAKGVLHCVWFSIPSSCLTFKQRRQSLALTLYAVSVTQKVTSNLPHLFGMQLKASQIS